MQSLSSDEFKTTARVTFQISTHTVLCQNRLEFYAVSPCLHHTFVTHTTTTTGNYINTDSNSNSVLFQSSVNMY